jgi:mRNA-degrading endonuclease toxin of MazEF toxin-antitoxin module
MISNMPQLPPPQKYSQGDVVLIPMLQKDEDGTTLVKRRPAVIVSNHPNTSDDVLIAPLTFAREENNAPGFVFVAMDSPAGKAAGLRCNSQIECESICLFPKTTFVNRIGTFPKDVMKRVYDQMRNLIEPLDEGSV